MSPELCNLAALLAQSALLAKAPNTLKAYQAENRLRKAWMAKKDLPEEEQSLLLYLAHRSQVVGSGSIAKAIAAFRMVNNNLSIFGGQLAGDLIKSMKKREIESRTQPSQISWTEVEKIVKRVDVQDPKSERNALITLISWTALLRASEAAEIKWTDLKREGDVLEIRVRHAKNDQLAQGRSTFVEYKDGTDLDILLSRWRVRCSEPAFKSDYIFFNLNNREKLSPSAISKVTKETLKNAGVEGATHHALRRGAANALRASGLSFEEVKAKGRWRSDASVARYLTDAPSAQGLHATTSTSLVKS
uniref:Tyr recombinase domain-containing protein n=2 Tax=Caenorhabditis japonica TaxID=281687 RepID=A0A2Q4TCV5_CAEJA